MQKCRREGRAWQPRAGLTPEMVEALASSLVSVNATFAEICGETKPAQEPHLSPKSEAYRDMQLQYSLLRQTRQALQAGQATGTPDKVADLMAALPYSDRSGRLDALLPELPTCDTDDATFLAEWKVWLNSVR